MTPPDQSINTLIHTIEHSTRLPPLLPSGGIQCGSEVAVCDGAEYYGGFLPGALFGLVEVVVQWAQAI